MKGLKKIGYFTAFIVPALVVTGFALGGWWNYLAIVFAFVVLPLIDQAGGLDTSNAEGPQAAKLGQEVYYRLVIYIWAWFQVAFVIWGLYVAAGNPFDSPWHWLGFVVSFALVTGGIGITVAHELGHKKSGLERFCSKMLLMTVCYMHFFIEHNRGHHVLVATPEDPATARKNEGFYRFWMRSVCLGYAHAWQLEKERLRKRGKQSVHFQNAMIGFTVLPLAFCAAATWIFSGATLNWSIPLFFFAQSFVAFTLLELVNYVEHYGIVRKQYEPGKYERVNPLHSWNASHLVSNFFLFQLQRHSDHHVHAIRPYQVLRHYDESPQLPFGYPTMILIALVPPLWFTMMNPRLEEWSQRVYQPGVVGLLA